MAKVTDDQLSSELKSAEKAKALEESKTKQKKAKFIAELKSGLGEEMKVNPGAIKIIKKTRGQKLGEFLRKIFTKF